MACNPCAVVRQYGYNALLLADLCLNGILGGDPHESLSARTARARAAGSRTATKFCAFLTWIGRNVFRQKLDHCDFALSKQSAEADEIWHWSPPSSP